MHEGTPLEASSFARALAAALFVAVLASGARVGAEPRARDRLALEASDWRSPATFERWSLLDPTTPLGEEAHRRLADAAVLYRRGIERWRADAAVDAAPLFRAASRVAPIDPELLPELARLYERDGRSDEAEALYLLYRSARPSGVSAPFVAERLARIASERARLAEADPLPPAFAVEPVAAPQAPSRGEEAAPHVLALSAAQAWALALSLAAIVAALLLAIRAVRDRPRGLTELAREAPELHPAIGYLVSALRHEVLKHRLGGLDAALLANGSGDDRMRLEFLRRRLDAGRPLVSAFAEHRAAFERTLGPRFSWNRDRSLRRATRAVKTLARLEHARGPRAEGRFLAALAELAVLDRELAALVRTLVRTRIDEGLLRFAVDEVRREYSAGTVELEELRIEADDDDVYVEVFRPDLVLVLRNLVRNAILATGASTAPRRVAVTADVELLPSGEELVRIAVHDTSPAKFDAERAARSSLDRGLGLVRTTLERYEGSLDVGRGAPGFAKAVTVRLFRASGEEPGHASDILAA